MPDLLLELLSEEIPARMQGRATEDLRKLVTERLVEAGLVYEGAKAFATPRRLALYVQGVPARQPDLREERKGPRLGAPEAAVQGFLKSAGLSSLAEATIQRDPKKGDFYVALIEKPGRPAIEVLAEILPIVIRTFPWPKSMRWGSGRLTWVRPLHSIVATFGPETEEPDIVPFAVDDIAAGNATRGHRFLSPKSFRVKRFDDYARKLEKAKVVLDPARRKDTIAHEARQLAFAQGLELVEDDALLDEVAGLVEWPVVLMGTFDPAFLSIPGEVIRSTIRNNQKCFVARRGAQALQSSAETQEGAAQGGMTNGLAPQFILVSNIEATDGGTSIVAGNERVIRARLSDAKFFYDTDLKTRLEDRLQKFKDIVFHEKLGSQWERIERIGLLAAELAPLVGADVEEAKRAALMCKADLLTEVVGEFPELQGVMGRYYALAQGEDESVARACEEHYKPIGPGDRVPADPVSVAVALADKIDTLVGFWAIDEKPTGSKDPFALRRAALGVIRLIVENDKRVCLVAAFSKHLETVSSSIANALRASGQKTFGIGKGLVSWNGRQVDQKCVDLLDFFAERLKVLLREQGARHDLVDAVFALAAQDDLLLIARRVDALARLLDSADGQNLLAGYKRATNIIRIEEKRDQASYAGAADPALYRQAEERELAQAIEAAEAEAKDAIAREDFAAAMSAMAKLRPHVDSFFERVTVNLEGGEEEKKIRVNRLKLLNQIRMATLAVADFSRIEG